jgi:hypothetical protein
MLGTADRGPSRHLLFGAARPTVCCAQRGWVIPRLSGPAKTALVTIEHDEYGASDPQRMHACLFAEMMTRLRLCPDYGAYLDAAPTATLPRSTSCRCVDCTAGYAVRWSASSPPWS